MNRHILLLLLLINFCFANESNPLYVSSKSLPNYNQQNFSEYVNENKQWLKDNRVFLSKNQNLELSLNTPFENLSIKMYQKEFYLFMDLEILQVILRI